MTLCDTLVSTCTCKFSQPYKRTKEGSKNPPQKEKKSSLQIVALKVQLEGNWKKNKHQILRPHTRWA